MRVTAPAAGLVTERQTDSTAFRNRDFDTAQKRAFVAGDSILSTGTQDALSQLSNPVGSGVLLIVDEFRAHTTVDIGLNIGSYVNVLANRHIFELPLYMGAPAPKAEIRWENIVGPVLTGLGLFFATANDWLPVIGNRPIIIPEGKNLTVDLLTGSGSIGVQYVWREIPQ